MFKKVFIALFLSSIVAFGQQTKKPVPVFHQISNKQLVQSVYPEAAKVVKVNAYWYKVVNSNQKILGYALSSTNYCKDVKGYNDVTPVMIITDKNYIIEKVALLSNYETQSYVNKLERNGFFRSLVGKSIKDVSANQLDGYTGATYTANAITKNVEFLLKNGSKKLPR
ncbi:MAG: FMN-binding protein [Bacteroidales bacterium]|nr:FMN-binding protein [Bacteroidales bacterium]